MAQFKVVIGDPKTGKCVQKEVADDAAAEFLGLKIGDTIKGDSFDLSGYEFQITGGSDDCGVPMRKDVPEIQRKRIYAVEGVGIKRKIKITKKGDRKIRRKRHGVKQRKLVVGNTIYEKTAQINLKVLKSGSKPLFEAAPAPEQK